MSAYPSARTRLGAVSAALALLVTLFPAVGSAAVIEACPASVPSSGYRDLAGLSPEAIDAIDCVAHYGVAQGVSSTQFDPTGTVTRWQMALFLTRMADDLGIGLPAPGVGRFDDVGNYPVETQQAIDQLAQLGITSGVGPRQFDPAGTVPRWQMALFLTRLHARAGYLLPSGAPQGFADIGSYPAPTQQAINQLVQLGLAKGTSVSTYAPAAMVLRWQMALFLSRELQAGGAEAYRVSVAADPATAPTNGQVAVTVTVLSPVGAPVVGRLVDVFVGSVDGAGRCVLDSDTAIGSGNAGTGTDCRIDNNDPKTDSAGKVRLTLTHTQTTETTRVFAWIGTTGDTFDVDDVSLVAFTDIVWSGVPTAIVVPAKTVKFGTQVTVTGWLVDSKGSVIQAAGQKIVVTVTRGGTEIIDQALVTASNGMFSFSYAGPSDPNANAGDDPVVDTVRAFWDRDGDGKDDGAAEFDVASTVTWDDAEPRTDKAVLAQNSISTLVGQTVTLTATVTDKFGTPIKDAVVDFIVSGANSANESKTTNSSGVASVSFVAANAGADTFDASVDVDGGGVDIPTSQVADLSHYTVAVAGDLAGPTTHSIMAVDTSANTMDVVSGGGYLRLTWDGTNDTFTVNGNATSMSTFESALSNLALPAPNRLTTNPYAAAASGASTFILTPP